jgi:type IV pilus assembly protein PilA
MFKRNEGFTLIELLVVILIIAILVAIALPIYLTTQDNARTRTCQANLRTIDGCITAYRTERTDGAFPTAGAAGVDLLMASFYLKSTPKCPSGTAPYQLVLGTSGSTMDASCMNNSKHTL